MVFRVQRRGGEPQIPDLDLDDRSVVVFTCDTQLGGNIWVPGDNFASHTTGGVGYFDDGIVLP